jgi:hypothetical protein
MKEVHDPKERQEALAALDHPDADQQKERQEQDAILQKWEQKLNADFTIR